MSNDYFRACDYERRGPSGSTSMGEERMMTLDAAVNSAVNAVENPDESHGLRVRVRRRGQDVELAGRLDSRTAPVARLVLHEAAERGDGDLVVSIEEVEIWDASGLGVLVGANRKARQCGRRLVLADVPPRQLRLLRATRLSRALTVEPLVVIPT